LSLNLEKNINVLYGQNGAGKTNILESIYICAVGRSFKKSKDVELIKFSTSETYISVLTDDTKRIDVFISRNQKKGIAINSIPLTKISDLFGRLLVIIFSPEDLNLIKDGPGARRHLMDIGICQVNRTYYYELRQYYKVLKHRNILLKKIKNDNTLKEQIFIWDEQLIKSAKKLIEIRSKFVQDISGVSNVIHKRLTNKSEDLKLVYRPNVVAKEYQDRLKANIEKDIIYGSTTLGIHRDDISFIVNNIDMKVFSSQGQKRTISLSLKLAEVSIIKRESGKYPILLLDDVFSELDEEKKYQLLNEIKEIQSIITCTDIENISAKNIMLKCNDINILDGQLYS
jgi:DNA replication and repair protein RecF